jgi:hypothetical protein
MDCDLGHQGLARSGGRGHDHAPARFQGDARLDLEGVRPVGQLVEELGEPGPCLCHLRRIRRTSQ